MTEQLTIDILYFLFYNVWNSCYVYVFLCYTLTPKFKKRFMIPALAAIHFTIYTLVTVFNPAISLRLFSTIAVLFIPAILCFKDTFLKRICAAALLFGVMMLCDVGVALAAYNLFGFIATQEEVKTWACIYQIVIINSIISILYFLTALLWRKKVNGYPVKSTSMFIMFPVSQAIAVCGYYYDSWDKMKLGPYTNPFAFVSIVLFILADIFMYNALRENAKVEEMRLKIKDMEHDMELQVQYYENIANQFTEIREYRHDIKNLLSAANMTLNNVSTREQGTALLNELNDKAENLEIPIFCANPIVNAVLWDKHKMASAENIDFEIKILPSETIPIAKTDACSLFANLLDNAIREATNIENAFIHISCKTEMNMLFLEVRNSSDKILDENQMPESTKEKGLHGYGLEIVEKIAQKYNGKFILKSDGKTATASFGAFLPESSEKN